MQVGFVRYEMKQRIKNGIPEEQRVVIKITPEIENNAEVFTRMHSREFRYRGEMYDVLSLEASGDTILYTCIHDVKESGLFKNLDKMVSYQLHHNSNEKHNRDLALHFFSQHYLALDNFRANAISTQFSSVYSYKDEPSRGFSAELFRPPIC